MESEFPVRNSFLKDLKKKVTKQWKSQQEYIIKLDIIKGEKYEHEI